MSKESIFQGALSNFIFEFTCGGAIRHLADQGCTARQITDRLGFPLPYDKVRRAMTDYFLEEGILLRGDPARGERPRRYTYVQDHGEYGKVSFRRMPAETDAGGESQQGSWTERSVTCGELAGILRRQVCSPGSGRDYAACAFGETGTEFEGSERLNGRQREYLQGICWDKRTMYHLLDHRMSEIVIQLCDCNFWRGKIYLEAGREILTPENV